MAKNDNVILGKGATKGSEEQQQESRSIPDLEGEGFLVHRAFPSKFVEDFDPFLLLDEFGSINLAPGEAKQIISSILS
jgi:redox-sensitive bicupin YhaK (pirin superfamily)